jgi:hypothetical protein
MNSKNPVNTSHNTPFSDAMSSTPRAIYRLSEVGESFLEGQNREGECGVIFPLKEEQKFLSLEETTSRRFPVSPQYQALVERLNRKIPALQNQLELLPRSLFLE